MATYKVLKIAGNENGSGQPVECFVGVGMEFSLDTDHINGDIPCSRKKHIAQVKLVGLKDIPAFEAGKRIDGSATKFVDIDVAENEDLMALFETAFGLLTPIVAQKIGATIEDAEIEEV